MGMLLESAKEPATKQIQALTLCFSHDTLAIVQNLGLTEEQRGNVDAVICSLKLYIDGYVNETVERRNFRRCTEQQGKSFNDFLVSLRELVKTCNFCSDACIQKNIRDQIIKGLLDGNTIETLLQKTDLTLQRTIHKCQTQEAATRERTKLSDGSVSAIHKPQDQKGYTPPMTRPDCGSKSHPTGRTQCPAYGQTYHNCQKIGHYAKVCCGKSTRHQGSHMSVLFVLNNQFCPTPTMLVPQVQHRWLLSMSLPSMVPVTLKHCLTRMQMYLQLVKRCSVISMSMLITLCLPKKSPGL